MRAAGFLAATALVTVTLPAAPNAFAMDKASSENLPLICAATHEYKGREVSVRRLFNRDGTEISDGNADRLAARAGDDAGTAKIRQQLFDYVSGLPKDIAKVPSKDCSPNDAYDGNEIHVFDCGQNWKDGNNYYSMTYNKAEWRYEEGNDWRMRMEWFLNSSHDWTVSGFPDRDHKTTFPTLFAVRPANWAAANYTVQVNKKERRWHRTELGQISVGKQEVRGWTDNNLFRILWNQWPNLMQGEGDVEFKVYDTQKGMLLQKTFPRNFLTDIETQMKTGYKAMMEQAENNVTSCKRLDSWEGGEDQSIVVT